MPKPVFGPPEGYSPADLKKGAAWCPYCRKETPFGWDGRLDYARCVECGISERDFYVRKFNGLWKDAALDAFVRGVRKSKRKYDKPFPWEKEDQADAALPERPCIAFGETFVPNSNRQKYCENCGGEIRREQRKQSVYRSRAKQKLSEGDDPCAQTHSLAHMRPTAEEHLPGKRPKPAGDRDLPPRGGNAPPARPGRDTEKGQLSRLP